jgi:hypothetical protein
LVGPVIGVRLGGPPGDRTVLGVEGGFGLLFERFNFGFEHRLNHELYYAEFDPWYWVGGSLGLGLDSRGDVQGIFGMWEGVPLGGNALHNCPPGYSSLVTLAVGIRYSGVLEFYGTFKAGVSEAICD